MTNNTTVSPNKKLHKKSKPLSTQIFNLETLSENHKTKTANMDDESTTLNKKQCSML